MYEELQYRVCRACLEAHMPIVGIWAQITHSCGGNKTTYRIFTGRAMMYSLKQLFDDYKDPFDDIDYFPSFEIMPDFGTATEQEKRWYSWQRESDIRTAKRLRLYLKKEEELLYK